MKQSFLSELLLKLSGSETTRRQFTARSVSLFPYVHCTEPPVQRETNLEGSGSKIHERFVSRVRTGNKYVGILMNFWKVVESGWKRADSNTKIIGISKRRGSSRSVQ